MADEVCGELYRITFLGMTKYAPCNRDKGHDQPGFDKGFWPPTDQSHAERLADYREHGYEDRTPF